MDENQTAMCPNCNGPMENGVCTACAPKGDAPMEAPADTPTA